MANQNCFIVRSGSLFFWEFGFPRLINDCGFIFSTKLSTLVSCNANAFFEGRLYALGNRRKTCNHNMQLYSN